MHLTDAVNTLWRTDSKTHLTRFSLGELFEGARDLAGVYDQKLDAEMNVYYNDDPGGTALQSDLHKVTKRMESYFPRINVLRTIAGMVASNSPCTAGEALCVFRTMSQRTPRMKARTVLVGGAAMPDGGAITVGSSLAVRGAGFPTKPDALYIRLAETTAGGAVWDLRTNSATTTGRFVETLNLIPSLGVGKTVSVCLCIVNPVDVESDPADSNLANTESSIMEAGMFRAPARVTVTTPFGGVITAPEV